MRVRVALCNPERDRKGSHKDSHTGRKGVFGGMEGREEVKGRAGGSRKKEVVFVLLENKAMKILSLRPRNKSKDNILPPHSISFLI